MFCDAIRVEDSSREGLSPTELPFNDSFLLLPKVVELSFIAMLTRAGSWAGATSKSVDLLHKNANEVEEGKPFPFYRDNRSGLEAGASSIFFGGGTRSKELIDNQAK